MELPPSKYRMSNGYVPKPLDFSTISLSAELEAELGGVLAENTHNKWASMRMSEVSCFCLMSKAEGGSNLLGCGYVVWVFAS
jgi:hypothetical protein